MKLLYTALPIEVTFNTSDSVAVRIPLAVAVRTIGRCSKYGHSTANRKIFASCSDFIPLQSLICTRRYSDSFHGPSTQCLSPLEDWIPQMKEILHVRVSAQTACFLNIIFLKA